MKPLELIAYPLDTSFPRGYVLPRDTRITVRAAERIAKNKRFTAAELAAELWHSIASYYALVPSPEAVMEASRNRTIERFATLPHYDEVQS